MAVLPSQSTLRAFYLRFIQEPITKIRERWSEYFARISVSEESPRITTSPRTMRQRNCHVQTADLSSDSPRELVTVITECTQKELIGRRTFILTALGMTFGLSQLWRFPNLAYSEGGAAFVYLCSGMTLLLGYPLFFLELALGHHTSRNVLKSHDRFLLVRGLNLVTIAYSCISAIYLAQMIGFGIFYLASSFSYQPPWSTCPANDPKIIGQSQCHKVSHLVNPDELLLRCVTGFQRLNYSTLCTNPDYQNAAITKCCPKKQGIAPPDKGGSYFTEMTNCTTHEWSLLCRPRDLPAIYFWKTTIEEISSKYSPTREYLGGARFKMLLCSFGAWLLVYMSISAGLRWFGLVAMFIIPIIFITYIPMTMVMVNMNGVMEGVWKSLVPKVEAFQSSEVWFAALQQSFFSLAIGLGPVVSLGAARKPKNTRSDSMLITLLLVGGSIITTTLVFGIIGNMAYTNAKTFEEVVDVGEAATIVAFSYILSKLPMAWLISSTFYFAFVVLCTISVSVVLFSISVSITSFSNISLKDRYILNFLIVFSCFLLSIPMSMQGGFSLMSVLHYVPINFSTFLIILLKLLVLYIYGMRRFSEDIKFMFGYYPSVIMRLMWILTPVIIIIIALSRVITFSLSGWKMWQVLTAFLLLGVVLFLMLIWMVQTVVVRVVKKNVNS